MKGAKYQISPFENGVELASLREDYSYCEFETRQEVDSFIIKLKKARDEVFK